MLQYSLNELYPPPSSPPPRHPTHLSNPINPRSKLAIEMQTEKNNYICVKLSKRVQKYRYRSAKKRVGGVVARAFTPYHVSKHPTFSICRRTPLACQHWARERSGMRHPSCTLPAS
jgi:hypothetical protein